MDFCTLFFLFRLFCQCRICFDNPCFFFLEQSKETIDYRKEYIPIANQINYDVTFNPIKCSTHARTSTLIETELKFEIPRMYSLAWLIVPGFKSLRVWISKENMKISSDSWASSFVKLTVECCGRVRANKLWNRLWLIKK